MWPIIALTFLYQDRIPSFKVYHPSIVCHSSIEYHQLSDTVHCTYFTECCHLFKDEHIIAETPFFSCTCLLCILDLFCDTFYKAFCFIFGELLKANSFSRMKRKISSAVIADNIYYMFWCIVSDILILSTVNYPPEQASFWDGLLLKISCAFWKQKGRFMAGKIVSHAYWEHTGKDRIKLLKGSTQCLQCIVHNLYLFPDPEDTCI